MSTNLALLKFSLLLFFVASKPALAETLQDSKKSLEIAYKQAQTFEEKSLLALSKAMTLTKKDPDDPNARDEFRNALLYGLEAQRWKLAREKEGIDANTLRQLSKINKNVIHLIEEHSFTYSPDSKQIAVIVDNKIQLRNAFSGQITKKLKVPQNDLLPQESYPGELVYSPNEKIIASRSADRDIIYFWDLSTGELIHTHKFESGYVHKFAFKPYGKMLLVELSDWFDNRTGKVIILDIKSGEELALPIKHYSGLTNFTFSRDGKLIAALDNKSQTDDKIKIWETKSRKLLRIYADGSKQSIFGMVFSPDNKNIYYHSNIKQQAKAGESEDIISTDNIKTLNLKSGQITKIIQFCSTKNDSQNCSLSFTPDGRKFVTGENSTGITKNTEVWDTQTFTSTYRFKHLDESYGAFSSPDGKTIHIHKPGGDGATYIIRINGPIYRFLYEFDPIEVSGVLQFLWELKFNGSDFMKSPHQSPVDAQNMDHIAWTDTTRKYQILMEMPSKNEGKLDQVVRWLEERCAYKKPELHSCKP